MERTQLDLTDEALRRLIEQPSYAAQLLTIAARLLQMDASAAMDDATLRRAMNIAIDAVLANLPEAVRETALERAESHLPDLAGVTRGEAALRLRAAAEVL
ncbi:hypothetical protein [Streptomyces sp. NBC_00557]|uniref:hypothetical protein n=1 Tax=Streptomyces sp. NBC_00557 TaxID=2975776 RepID=UPI002E8086BC|nr:hypothetical protein [Streptomyces sp. NBC_00557]WUC36370.1 hypothetical protein OG956_20175 [Streptomyces sp. NBC_00557]